MGGKGGGGGGVAEYTRLGNMYDLRFSTTSVRGSETETKLRVARRRVEVH